MRQAMSRLTLSALSMGRASTARRSSWSGRWPAFRRGAVPRWDGPGGFGADLFGEVVGQGVVGCGLVAQGSRDSVLGCRDAALDGEFAGLGGEVVQGFVAAGGAGVGGVEQQVGVVAGLVGGDEDGGELGPVAVLGDGRYGGSGSFGGGSGVPVQVGGGDVGVACGRGVGGCDGAQRERRVRRGLGVEGGGVQAQECGVAGGVGCGGWWRWAGPGGARRCGG
ncbi:hypothetical protein GXW82_23365 [Streptacidiphilus sp. 4-A2]|nr:hypothetical protein [Streptacidiphilus sp. 4-A2]